MVLATNNNTSQSVKNFHSKNYSSKMCNVENVSKLKRLRVIAVFLHYNRPQQMSPSSGICGEDVGGKPQLSLIHYI